MRTTIRARLAGSGRGGFTLLEMLIALSLVALIVTNLVMVLGTSTQAYRSGASVDEVDAQARRTLDRIALAVMGSSRAGLVPGQPFPQDTSSLTYQLALGFQDGAPVWSDPERIEKDGVPGQVVWAQNPETASERQVVWTRWVRDFLEGEIPNGVDDNDNGLVDERGLSFTLDGDLVTIRLTLERQGPDGRPIMRTIETQVTVRN